MNQYFPHLISLKYLVSMLIVMEFENRSLVPHQSTIMLIDYTLRLMQQLQIIPIFFWWTDRNKNEDINQMPFHCDLEVVDDGEVLCR